MASHFDYVKNEWTNSIKPLFEKKLVEFCCYTDDIKMFMDKVETLILSSDSSHADKVMLNYKIVESEVEDLCFESMV